MRGYLCLVLGVLLSVSAWGGPVFVLQSPTPEMDARLGYRATGGIGDVTRDGYADVLLGAYRADVSKRSEAGEVYLFSGHDGAYVETLRSPNLEFGGLFGRSVLGFDDVNADGVPELVIGAEAETAGARGSGRVYIFDGATRSLVDTLTSSNPAELGQFGVSLGRVPDVNNDGVDELAVGAYREVVGGVGESGRAYIFDGATRALLHTLVHPEGQLGTVFGIVVDGIDDVNGDGAGDILVGASGSDVFEVAGSGQAFVFDGVTGTLIHTLYSPLPRSAAFLGFAMASVPDVNGDGVMDIAVGSHGDAYDDLENSGSLHVFDGATGEHLYLVNPDAQEGAVFSIWVDGIADVNGDGAGDIIVGAQNYDTDGVESAGRAYLLSGATGGILRILDPPTPQAFGYAGFSVAAMEDASGDGLPEVLVAAWGATVNHLSGAGEAYLFYSPLGSGGVSLEECEAACAGAAEVDVDGDGLSACVEACLGTRDDAVDTDHDGMPDNFEVVHGLDPLRDESAGDFDGDGLSNLDEFLRDASPSDAMDPDMVVFVRNDGADVPGGGSLSAPWRTVGYALSQVTGTGNAPVRVVLLGGDYMEDVTLKPYVSVEGSGGTRPRILGVVLGAMAAGLANLDVVHGGDGALLRVAAGMKVEDVEFSGGAGTGILVVAGGGSGTDIDRCTFSGLAVGLDVWGAFPLVRRCTFDGCSQSGVVLRSGAAKGGAKGLGDATDARSGWNTFRNNGTFNVVNEGAAPVAMELNDWGTEDPVAIAASISGGADFEPFLAVGGAVLASSLFCTVWDAENQTRIETATVSLEPGVYAPVTENRAGVYAFPVLLGGSYTLRVRAAGFADATQVLSIGDGELVSLTVPLGGTGKTGPGCHAGASGGVVPGGAALLMAGVVAMILVGAMRRGGGRMKDEGGGDI